MSRKAAVLIFGEDDNDQSALSELVHALRGDIPKVEKRRKPLILVKGRDAAKQRQNARDVANVVKADNIRLDVRLVVAHQDCDAIEPAHDQLANEIEQRLHAVGINAIAATPAWEIEAWWYLWPDAVSATNKKWRRLNRTNQEVGRIQNAKEALKRDLRPQVKGQSCADYQESDASKIARNVRVMGIINHLSARSASFDRFADRVRKAQL